MPYSPSYTIHIGALKEGEHRMTYNVKDQFFQQLPPVAWKGIDLNVSIILKKKNSFFETTFTMDGQVEMPCDRCMNCIPIALHRIFDVLFKYSLDYEKDNEKGMDPFVHYLPSQEVYWDVAPWIYDFMMLSIPDIRKCSDEDAISKKYCDMDVLGRIM